METMVGSTNQVAMQQTKMRACVHFLSFIPCLLERAGAGRLRFLPLTSTLKGRSSIHHHILGLL